MTGYRRLRLPSLAEDLDEMQGTTAFEGGLVREDLEALADDGPLDFRQTPAFHAAVRAGLAERSRRRSGAQERP